MLIATIQEGPDGKGDVGCKGAAEGGSVSENLDGVAEVGRIPTVVVQRAEEGVDDGTVNGIRGFRV